MLGFVGEGSGICGQSDRHSKCVYWRGDVVCLHTGDCGVEITCLYMIILAAPVTDIRYVGSWIGRSRGNAYEGRIVVASKSHLRQSRNARRQCWMHPSSIRILVWPTPLGARWVLVHLRPGWDPHGLGGGEGWVRHDVGKFPIRVGPVPLVVLCCWLFHCLFWLMQLKVRL